MVARTHFPRIARQRQDDDRESAHEGSYCTTQSGHHPGRQDARATRSQMSVRQIFTKARQTAPCLLLFEDLDSLVTDQVRSYFFNEVDGLEDNQGILMIGSTNNCTVPTAGFKHAYRTGKELMNPTVDKLDAGLSKRPSRFDRKYRFNNPSFDDRPRYCEYWRYVRPPRIVLPLICHLTRTLARSSPEDLQRLHPPLYHTTSLRSLMASAVRT